jgi:pyrroline-5-carboxylate reductase
VIDQRITFLGAGNMANAIIRGLIRAGAKPSNITATVKREEKKAELEQTHGITAGFDNVAAARAADIVVLAVKPQAMDKLLTQIAPVIDAKKLVISVAAGVPIAAIERRFGGGARIVRSMPNTPALVGLGATAVSGGEHATPADLELAKEIFDRVGRTVRGRRGAPRRGHRALGQRAGVHLSHHRRAGRRGREGRPLPRRRARARGPDRLRLRAAPAADRRAPRQAEGPGDLPRRHGHRGLHTLEAGGLRTTLITAVEAATRRSKELGDSFLEKQ